MSIKKSIQFLSMMAVMALSGSAVAQSAPQATRYDFDDDLVQGDLVRPDGTGVVGTIQPKRVTLIEIRQHFVPQLLKSIQTI